MAARATAGPFARLKEEKLMRSTYVLDNAAQQATSRFRALADIFDPGTIRHLGACGIQQGWRCLEVGAGGGSIARWMADRVGSTGHVVATDVDTRFLETVHLQNLEILRHNVTSDSLPTEAFDLVHARLVVMHLPDRSTVLSRLVAALKPGAWLVIEDFEMPHEEIPRTWAALLHVLVTQGVDVRHGRTLSDRFLAEGLVDVDVEGRSYLWRGGSAGAALLRANYEQLRNPIFETGLVTEAQFKQDLAQLSDPHFVVRSPTMWAAWGRRPFLCQEGSLTETGIV
jgi:2-polyprenyl-3-methyl-5-hydroxy-6-metoxy-1,4-benzoquinol methylase